ncbi:MAG TPA: PP2C family serine/threonine-protein phosphatase [Polyangiaceae bacterium]|nr:PP2C family serine/threonine-protein phosphatase [Polyangiaceae bacterium]
MSVTLGPPNELFEIASRSHPGLVREANEDHCATFFAEDCAGLVVADGVSGFNGAETASRLAVEVTLEAFLDAEKSLPLSKRLHRAVQRANIAVHDLALVVPELRGMATTLTAVLLAQGELCAAHIGDCRLYLARAGRLLQLTKDHTVAAQQLRLRLLSKTRARRHPGWSTLTRSLGRELIARVDQFSAPILAGDLLMLCSDGVHGLLDDAELLAACGDRSAEGACEALISAAHERGSPDNVTAAVARVSGTASTPPDGQGLLGRLNRTFGRRSF